MRTTPFTPAAEFDQVRPRTMTDQTQRLKEYLQSPSNTIHFVQAMDMKIDNLRDRIKELRAEDVHVYQREIRIKGITCPEYSLYPFPDQHADQNTITPAAAQQPVNEAFKDRKR